MSSDEIVLSVAIPTYNRNVRLNETLLALLPQMTAECELLILDNASPNPVTDTCSEILSEFPHVLVHLIRNRTNIGGDANICQCIELANGRYVWVLGDDDHLLPDSIQVALATVNEMRDAVFINFSTQMCTRTTRTMCHGAMDFISKMDSFANILFISASIFSTEAMRQKLRFANQFTYSMAPLLAALFMVLQDDRTAVLTNRSIIEWGKPAPGMQWSVVDQALGRMVLLELPMTSPMRRALASKIVPSAFEIILIAYKLIAQAVVSGDLASSLFYYDHIRYRCRYYDRHIGRKMVMFLCRWLVCFPNLSLKMFRFTSHCFGMPRKESIEMALSIN